VLRQVFEDLQREHHRLDPLAALRS